MSTNIFKCIFLVLSDFFQKHDVAVMTVRELFEFITDPSITSDNINEYLDKVSELQWCFIGNLNNRLFLFLVAFCAFWQAWCDWVHTFVAVGFFFYLQAMEIASERTAEDRSNQDKVDEEVNSFLTFLNICIPVQATRVQSWQIELLNSNVCSPEKVMESRCNENVKYHCNILSVVHMRVFLSDFPRSKIVKIIVQYNSLWALV